MNHAPLRRILLCVSLLVCFQGLPLLAQSQESMLQVETIKEDDADIVMAHNLSQTPLTVTLSLVSSTNIASTSNWPVVRLLKAGETSELVRVTAEDKQERFAFEFHYEYKVGQANLGQAATVTTPSQPTVKKSKKERTLKECAADGIVDEATIQCMRRR